MKKSLWKWLKLAAAGCLCIAAMGKANVAQAAVVASGNYGENDEFYWEYNSEGRSLTISGTGELPDMQWGQQVPWKSFANRMNALVIEEGITGIGAHVFADCSFGSIKLPDSIERIGSGAFINSHVSTFYIPKNCKNIEDGVLVGESVGNIEVAKENEYFVFEKDILYKLENGEKTDFVIVVGQSAMNLDSFLIPEGIKRISGMAVFGTQVKEFILPSTIEYIGLQAFSYAKFEKITINSTAPNLKLGDSVFCHSTNVHEINLPGTVKDIPISTFEECTGLEKVVLNNGTEGIEDHAFGNCTNLTCVEIPESVTGISDNAFEGCDFEKLTLYVKQGSYADSYAKKNGIKVKYVSGQTGVAAPMNLAATAGDASVTVTWDAVSGAKQYALYLKRTNGELVLVTNKITATSYTVNGLANGTTVGFVVKAYGNGKWSDWSATAWATPKAYEAVAPANVTVTAGDGSAVVSWDAVPGAQMYAIFLKRTNGEVVLIDNRVTATTYNVPGLANGTTVGFVVKSYVGKKWSGWSTVAWATPQIPVVPPTGVTAAAGNGSVTVSWDAVPGAQTYAVFLKKTDGEVVLVHNRVSGTSYTVNGLANGTKVGFVVKAYIPKTWSTWSTVAWTTPTAGK